MAESSHRFIASCILPFGWDDRPGGSIVDFEIPNRFVVGIFDHPDRAWPGLLAYSFSAPQLTVEFCFALRVHPMQCNGLLTVVDKDHFEFTTIGF